MLKRLVALILFGMIGAGLASWLSSQSGSLQLEWFGWRLQMPTSLAAAIVIVMAVLLLFFDRVVRGILGLPNWFGRTLDQRRDASGHKALTLGLMAVAAGEQREALKQATRAERLLNAPQLTALLSAQAAHLAGDHRAATRYFKSLTGQRDTAFLGYTGLARLALDNQDKSAALSAARAAQELKPKSVMVAGHILALEADAGNWEKAAGVIDLLVAEADHHARKRTASGDDEQSASGNIRRLARQKTALHYLVAMKFKNGDTTGGQPSKQVIKALEAALDSDPGFRPAVLCLADIHLAAGARRKATKTLEAGFKAMPHATIADHLKAAWGVNEGTFISRMIKLASQTSSQTSSQASSQTSSQKSDQPSHSSNKVVARLIVAEQAFALGLIGEARGQLEMIDADDRDAAAWKLAAQIADHPDHVGYDVEASGDSAGDIRAAADYLRRASDAPRPMSWQCDDCHSLQADWHAHCPDCHSFGALEWRRPEHLTPLGISQSVKMPVQVPGE